MRTFAVAGTEKISNWGDVVLFRDTDHFAQDKAPWKSSQGRPDIDCDKLETGVGDFADTAVKSPGWAVDRKGQSVNIRIGNNAFAFKFAQICIISNAKKKEQIAEWDSGNQQVSGVVVDCPLLFY